MNQTHAISVVTAEYNVAPNLGECLDSDRAQTFTDQKHISANDGSTDGFAAIRDECAAKDKWFNAIQRMETEHLFAATC